MQHFAGKHLGALAARLVAASALVVVVGLAGVSLAQAKPMAFISKFTTFNTLSTAVPASGPAKGDVNPYGVAVVKRSTGDLTKGDVLVSNFNNSANAQGTGSSIVEVKPSTGAQHVFAVVPHPTSNKAVGLTTALVVLRSGFVIVGSLPAPGGNSSKATAGALTILNSHGHVVKTIKGGDINGPWDMSAVDRGSRATLFVTNVLNGTVAAKGKVVNQGTVVRLELRIKPGHVPVVTSNTVIGSGFAEHTDPNALVVGPTGVALGRGGTLYVADSANDRIAAIPQAMTRASAMAGGGRTVSKGGLITDPLGLLIAPNGDVVDANGANGDIVETTPAGKQLVAAVLIKNGGGDLFGIALAPHNSGIYLVDDNGAGPSANSLVLWN